MVRRRACAVSNHEFAAILRDARKDALLGMRQCVPHDRLRE